MQTHHSCGDVGSGTTISFINEDELGQVEKFICLLFFFGQIHLCMLFKMNQVDTLILLLIINSDKRAKRLQLKQQQ